MERVHRGGGPIPQVRDGAGVEQLGIGGGGGHGGGGGVVRGPQPPVVVSG